MGMSKWRNGATSKKNNAFEKLYKSIEKQMVKKKNKESSDEETKEIEADANDVEEEDNDDNGKGKDKETQAKTQQIGKKLDKGDDKESSKENEENQKKMPANSLDDERNMVATNNIIAQSKRKWEKAYPRTSRTGKKIVLCDYATVEERLPPTQ